MTLIPDFYRPPLGLPLNWRDEVSGVLSGAVAAYLDNRVDGKPIGAHDLDLVREYIVHYIDAPCWDNDEFSQELAFLRRTARELRTPENIGKWIRDAMEIGLDPL